MSENSIIKIHCNTCGRETKHSLLTSRMTPDEEFIENYGPIHWEDKYEMLECCGCESVMMRHTNWFSETNEVTIDLFPPAVSRRIPKWKNKLPRSIVGLLDEIYTTLHSDGRRLAIMGTRAIIDMVILDKVGDIGTFREKLKALEDQGFIGAKNRKFLAAALEAGHAAVHRGHIPKQEEVSNVMDIVENLLEAVYVLEEAAEKLTKTTPPRKRT